MSRAWLTAVSLSAAVLGGCSCGPELERPRPAGTPTDALVDADPSSVSDAQLAVAVELAEEHYWAYAQYEGVCWEPSRTDREHEHPDTYGKGGDSALFTGQALAAFTLKALATEGEDHVRALDQALRSMRGLWYVTHVAGRGVIARCAFPAALSDRWQYPEKWSSRIEDYPDFVGESTDNTEGPPLPAGLAAPFPPSVYYTRATKDQLTGLVFGLAAAWHSQLMDLAPAAKVAAIDLIEHLRAHDWRIRDENGRNDTSADDVDGLLKVAVVALWRAVGDVPPAVEREYQAAFEDGLDTPDDWFNAFANTSQYFAHNLRAMRAFTIWLLDEDKRQASADYFRDHVWHHVSTHRNAWFESLAAVMLGDEEARVAAANSLRSLSLRPLRDWPSPYGGQDAAPPWWAHFLTGCASKYVLPPHLRKPGGYSTWEREPWDVGSGKPGGKLPASSSTGLGLILPTWVLKLPSGM